MYILDRIIGAMNNSHISQKELCSHLGLGAQSFTNWKNGHMVKLNVPDKYAMERGGWASTSILKSVYQHTFSDERIAVDNTIDTYFSSIMQHEMQHEIKAKDVPLIKRNAFRNSFYAWQMS